MTQTSPLDLLIRQFDRPDEVRTFSKGRFEIVRIGPLTIGRATYDPGWNGSEDVEPQLNSLRRGIEHLGLVVSGAATAAFDDGQIVTLKAGDLFYIPPIPHDCWVIGSEPCVFLHFLGTDKYVAVDDHPNQPGNEGDAYCFVCGSSNSASPGVSFHRDAEEGSRTTDVARREHNGWPGRFTVASSSPCWMTLSTGGSLSGTAVCHRSGEDPLPKARSDRCCPGDNCTRSSGWTQADGFGSRVYAKVPVKL